jgi:Uma2 family endonuclease
MATVISLVDVSSLESDPSDGDRLFEIVDGQLQERPDMGAQSDRLGFFLACLIETHAGAGKLGLCFSGQCGYQKIFPHEPKRLRYPDVSFVRSGRLPGNKPPEGHMEIVPDLVAEVVSPNDNAVDIEQRLTDFMRAGVPLAWIIYPQTRQVYVFHQGPAALRLGEGDILEGEDVLPGFSLALKDLFAAI